MQYLCWDAYTISLTSLRRMVAMYSNGSVDMDDSDFEPIPELSQPDADLYLIFLSANGIYFSGQLEDPWFNASRLLGVAHADDAGEDTVTTVYAAAEPASPLACLAQEQICSPGFPEANHCGPLKGQLDAFSTPADNLVSRSQQTVYDRYHWIFNNMMQVSIRVSDVIQSMGGQALTARNSLQSGMQGALSDTQWQTEVYHWHNTTLANLQAVFVDTATGPKDASIKRWVQGPNNTVEAQTCKSQKILSTAYINFSVFGLVFMFVAGSLVVLVSFALEPCLRCVRRRFRLDRWEYSHLEWAMNQTLQLQRLAHEEVGAGTWAGGIRAIPVTRKGEELAILDVSDPGHPRLAGPLVLKAVDSVPQTEVDSDRLPQGTKGPLRVSSVAPGRHTGEEQTGHLPDSVEVRVDEVSPVSTLVSGCDAPADYAESRKVPPS